MLHVRTMICVSAVCAAMCAAMPAAPPVIAQEAATSSSTEKSAPVWTPELALQVKNVGSVVVAPDGKRVAWTVSQARMTDDQSDWLTHIHIASIDGSGAVQLTRGEKSCGGPQWSPDSQWIAFTSARGGESASLYRINVNGGEAERLTTTESSVGQFKWSPDGSHIALAMVDPLPEEQTMRAKQKDDARVVDENIRMSHLHVVAIEPNDDGERSVRRLTEGQFNVASAFAGGFDWSPDGAKIAFAHTKSPSVDHWPTADISIVEVASSEITSLIATEAAESSPLYSPDGSVIAFTQSDAPATWAFTSRVCLIDAAGGTQRRLERTYDEQPSIIGFAPDGQSLFVSETYRTGGRIARLPLRGRPQWINSSEHHVSGPTLNATGTHFGFTMASPDKPSEAHVSTAASFEPVQVASSNDHLPDAPLGRTEVLTWTSNDGTEVEGLLTYPVGHQRSQRVPLLVVIHGGPTGVFTRSYIASRGAYPIAAFAAQGYAVLRTNPRGSSGYGKDFRYANYEDWGGGDYQDIMTGVDHVISMGVADPDRMGVMGWSYGGFMTSWVVTQTDRFAAASVGAGVTNLMSFTGTADIPGFLPDYFGGEVWDEFETWASHSAMFNVAGVTTPTLIQHGEQDLRVPISQGYEFYNALKRQNVPVKMVVYPRQPHGIVEPKLARDAMQRNIDWFNQWVKKGSAG